MKISSKNIKGILFLFTSAFLYSLMPVMMRTLGSEGVPPMSQVFLRYIFAFVAAAIYLFIFNKEKIKIEKKDMLLFAVATVFCYSLTNLFLTYGILFTQISNALFLFYSNAIITPVLGYFILKEKINNRKIAALILSLIALVLLFQPNSFPTWKIGGIFALLAALGQSLYIIIRKILKKYSIGIMMILNTLVGVIVLGLMALIFESSFYVKGSLFTLSTNTWLLTIFFGFDNFLAWFFMIKGFELFEATVGSVILLSELVFGVLLAILFFKETPTLITIIGGSLILISSLLIILKKE